MCAPHFLVRLLHCSPGRLDALTGSCHRALTDGAVADEGMATESGGAQYPRRLPGHDLAHERGREGPAGALRRSEAGDRTALDAWNGPQELRTAAAAAPDPADQAEVGLGEC